MEINLGSESIVELQAMLSAEEVQERALARRVDAFGQMAKLFQRTKPEEIEITTIQKRYEPFWYIKAKSHYSYDRRHTYRVEVAPEVQEVTVYERKHTVTRNQTGGFELEAMEHCVEESIQELTVDATSGKEIDLRKYLTFQRMEVPDIAALEKDGALIELPEVRSSFVVRNVVSKLMKTFQADKIHEEMIDVEEISLCYRPVYVVEYSWTAKNKKQVEAFDALTGEVKAEGPEIMRRVKNVLQNDALFDIGADSVGMLLPGANIAIKLGRLAARKAVKQ